MGRKTKAQKSANLVSSFLDDLNEEVSDGQNVSDLFSCPSSDVEEKIFQNEAIQESLLVEKDEISIQKSILKTEQDQKKRNTIKQYKKVSSENFYLSLVDAGLSSSETKILKYLYEKNFSSTNIIASRQEIISSTGISATGFVRCIKMLNEKGILLCNKVSKDGTKVKVNSFDIIL